MKKILCIGAALLTSLVFADPSQININTKEKPVTNGWADMGEIRYASENIIIISDATYSSAEKNSRLSQMQSPQVLHHHLPLMTKKPSLF